MSELISELKAKDKALAQAIAVNLANSELIEEQEERIVALEAQCIAEGRIVAKCNLYIEKLENMLREMIDMVPQTYEFRKNSANRAQVVLDWEDKP